MPKYSQAGLKFTYPPDWELTEEETTAWPRSVSFQIPGGGYWSVFLYPPNTDCLDLLQEALASLKSEFKDVEVEDVQDAISNCLAEGHNLSFFCLDLPVECQLRSLEAPGGTLLWIYQAEALDFEERADSFRQIAESLLESFVQR